MHSTISIITTACLLLASTGCAESLYSRKSGVLQVTAKDFDQKIKNTYNASIVEFYAPWCGHCKNLKPAFEKAAQNLEGIAQVAAINCDDEENKEFCGRMGVQGFPTLKTVRQTGTFGKPIISDYQGARATGDIVEAVKGLLPNYVTRLQDKEWSSWLEKKNDTAKAILFSDKGTTSALIKSLANDFYESIEIAQVRNKEKAINEVFGISQYPSLVILPGGDKDAVIYDGALKRPGMLAFLGQYGKVRSVPTKGSKKPASNSKPDKKASSAFSKASASQASEEASSSAATASTVTLEEPVTESPDPFVTPEASPVVVPDTPEPVTTFETQEDLQTKCLSSKSNTCVFALIRDSQDAESMKALASLASVSQKHARRGDHLFPFYNIPASSPAFEAAQKALGLEASTQPLLIAINRKRSWWRQHDTSKGFDVQAVESWIDGIRLGDSKKNKLPEDFLVVPATSSSASDASSSVAPSSAGSEEPEPSLAHGEL